MSFALRFTSIAPNVLSRNSSALRRIKYFRKFLALQESIEYCNGEFATRTSEIMSKKITFEVSSSMGIILSF